MTLTVEERIQQTCIHHGWTLSVAESCTGGAVAARLTRLSGSSKYFLGSVVVYSNILKIKLLGINSTLLEELGAVSEEITKQMAQNILELTQSHYSIAVTGIAGPTGGTASQPVGTIWAAIASRGESIPLSWSFQLTGNRLQIIQQAVDVLLERLWLLIDKNQLNKYE